MAISNASSESHLRSVAKGISYRFVGTLFTATLSFAMTGSIKTAMMLGSAEVTVKVLLFWGHERVWARVRWGRAHAAVTLESDVSVDVPDSTPSPAPARPSVGPRDLRAT